MIRKTAALVVTAVALMGAAPVALAGHSGPRPHSGPEPQPTLACSTVGENDETKTRLVVDGGGSGPTRYGYRDVTYHVVTITCDDGTDYSSRVVISRGPVAWL
jgi:hypothetical protein